MKKSFCAFAVICCLTACGTKEKTEQPVVRPVKVAEVHSLAVISKNYAGVVESANTTNLAFKVSGQLVDFPVCSGDHVKPGDLIAQLDTRDFELNREAKQSAYITAKAQYERLQRLLEKEAVSKQDFEIAKTKYDQAKAELENSENQLADTRLIAPIAGTIESCGADNFQRISAGQTIVRIVDTKNIQVKFYLADYNLQELRQAKATFWVRFGAKSTKYYKAKLKDYTDISTDGSGIPVNLAINDPAFDNPETIKPGFACDVRVDFKFSDEEDKKVVPITAVFDDKTTGEKSVWVVREGTIERRVVEVSDMVGDAQLAVTEGIAEGELVVMAGAVTLNEGDKVKIIE